MCVGKNTIGVVRFAQHSSDTDGAIDDNDDEDDRKSYDIDQNDFEFAPHNTFKTNV